MTTFYRLQQQSAGDALSREICAHDAEHTRQYQQPYSSVTTAVQRQQKAPAEAGGLHRLGAINQQLVLARAFG